MEYSTKTYFVENEEPLVKGFSIVAVSPENGNYQIVEKWARDEEDGGPKWVQYTIPEAQLLSRVRDGSCEKKGKLTDEQYEAVTDNVAHSQVTA